MLDSNGMAQMVAEHPRLFHVVYRADTDSHESVTEHGLVTGAPMRHHWHGLYRPRPGHLYLTTASQLPRVRNWGRRDCSVDVYAVDSASLIPSRLTADEDWFIADDWVATSNMIGERHACQVFKLPLPPTPWMWEWATYLKLHPLPSYGEWAEAVNLGSDPRQTLYSMQRGSVAYRGDIQPAALQHIFTTRETQC